MDSYALEPKLRLRDLVDIDKKIVETGEDIIFFRNKTTSWSGNTSKGKVNETNEIDR